MVEVYFKGPTVKRQLLLQLGLAVGEMPVQGNGILEGKVRMGLVKLQLGKITDTMYLNFSTGPLKMRCATKNTVKLNLCQMIHLIM